MSAGRLNLIKLSVGTESVEDLADWYAGSPARNAAAGHAPKITHVTRMWPRREGELLDGGSIYWVIKGLVLCRQRILSLDPRTGSDGIRRCAIVLDPVLVRTRAQSRRAFQGWRYLAAADAPGDIGVYQTGQDELPHALQSALADIGVF